MEFLALGPVAVLRDGSKVDLGSPQQKSVLVLLLVHRNQTVATDRILHELWGDDSDGKLNALRVYVSRLRTALDPERGRGEPSILETVDSGYRLAVEPEQLDIDRFTAGVSNGRAVMSSDPEEASRILHSALALWRGHAFEEYRDADFVRFESTRLADLRIDALEDRISADFACGRDVDLISELEGLRHEHPLRERFVEHQALALYRSGRPAEALRSIERFRRHVGEELGIDPSPRLLRLEERVLLHDEEIQPRRATPELASNRSATNPFLGLRSFGTDDASRFFGRETLIAEMGQNVQSGGLVALVGASGSGKSSAIHAGLIPMLAKNALEGSDQWLIASMVPGTQPFAELDAALVHAASDTPGSFAEYLRSGDEGLVAAAHHLLPDNESHLLLIIDQLEELFTLDVEPTERDRFLANIVTAADDSQQRVTVVVAVRSDFCARHRSHPAFGSRLDAGSIAVAPLSAEELEAAALRPAHEQGVDFEPALLGRLIADFDRQPGALPLFQYALTELFDKRTNTMLTAASYKEMGGLDGALGRRAERLFDDLDDRQKFAAKQLFLRLVMIGDSGQRSRRRVPAREIVSVSVDTVAMQDVIGKFGEHRLLSFDSDRLTGAPTVEVAHEALLSAWHRLDEWLDESSDDLRRHWAFTVALREWELGGRQPGYLFTAARLAEFSEHTRTSALVLNAAEFEFLSASMANVEEEHEVSERQQHNQTTTRKRLVGLITVLGVALVVAGVLLLSS